jgi:hypothetical protein
MRMGRRAVSCATPATGRLVMRDQRPGTGRGGDRSMARVRNCIAMRAFPSCLQRGSVSLRRGHWAAKTIATKGCSLLAARVAGHHTGADLRRRSKRRIRPPPGNHRPPVALSNPRPDRAERCIFRCNCLSSPLFYRKQDSDGRGMALPRFFHGRRMDASWSHHGRMTVLPWSLGGLSRNIKLPAFAVA